MCKYCENANNDLFNNRELSKFNDGYYTGFEVYIRNGNLLQIHSSLDCKFIKPISGDAYFPILFCPACGTRLKQEETNNGRT